MNCFDDVDRKAVFQQPKLFKLFALLQGALFQIAEFFQNMLAEGVYSHVSVVVAVFAVSGIGDC